MVDDLVPTEPDATPPGSAATKRTASPTAEEQPRKSARKAAKVAKEGEVWVGAWINDARARMIAASEDPEIHELVERWARLEATLGKPEVRKGYQLDAKQRPAELTAWLKKQTPDTAPPPSIKNVTDFLARFKAYYYSLQPLKRLAGAKLLKTDCNATDWTRLMKGSRFGFFSLVVSLTWLQTKATTKKDKVLVHTMVSDAVWVLGEMALHATSSV
ncbi:hypothetical protein BD410DRAFT_166356 [Rickenella mellea]|uniref:Uncharacterized protein n=1 Tax=Rickenella mellea TaxID=50990 RepID=A0A4Y7PH85_9AGAM|nr:hypothetical protein BD410DRAFT_166356 [Rickenella mellea]